MKVETPATTVIGFVPTVGIRSRRKGLTMHDPPIENLHESEMSKLIDDLHKLKAENAKLQEEVKRIDRIAYPSEQIIALEKLAKSITNAED